MTIVNQHGLPISSAMGSEAPLYIGANTNERMGNWGLSSAGPNAGLGGISNIRSRARQLERNNPMVAGAIDSFVSNLVGVAITPEWHIENLEQKAEFKSLWDDCLSQIDYMGFIDFYGLQEIMARSMVRDGEGFCVIHELDPHPDIYVPIQLQALEADHLDLSYNDIAPNGNEIRHSIEWKNGKPVAYWVYENHPGERYLTSLGFNRVRIPCTDMLHIFRLLRAGQSRGVSFLKSIIVKLVEIEAYDDAEVVKKKVSALWGGFIYQDNSLLPPTMPGERGAKDNGVQSISLKAGTFPVLRNGMKIAFNDTLDVGQNYDTFMKWQFRIVARGIGITYEQLTGDLSGVNYTSIRAGLIEFRRLCETIVARTLVFQFCRPFINRWIRTAILTRAIKSVSIKEYTDNPRLFHRVDWHPHGWDFTDPVKDRVAEQMDIRNGLTSRRRIAAKHNRSVEVVDEENAEDLKRAEENGLRYDCYASHSNKAGTSQKIEERVIDDSLKVE